MRYVSLAVLSFACIFFSGCVSNQQIAKPASSETASTIPNPSSAHYSKQSPSGEAEKAKADSPVGEEQEKIDRALDLCSHAQTFWEKGDFDQALSSLDDAYSLILEVPAQGQGTEQSGLDQQKDDVRFLISKRILEIYASRQVTTTGHYDEIPLVLNEHVQAEIKRLTGRERQFFIRSLERSFRYRPYIVEALKKEGLPEEISWLPLIESGFKIKALSSARALGLWQFIPSTGYKFGLSRNRYVDERMDPEKATKAAISYLKELHSLFGDWTTALAAYNCGEGRVLKLIRRQKINYLDNFWDLYLQLPLETARYVPRFLATVHIVKNLEKYGISVQKPLAPIAYEVFEVNKKLRLADISKAAGIPLSALKELNPELRYATLPPEKYQLRVPREKATGFLASIESLKPTAYEPGPAYVYHRVRKGETLSSIARKCNSSVRSIARANKIRSTSRIYVGKLLKVPTRYRKNSRSSVPAYSTARISRGQKIRYRVKKGDNLWSIARRMGTTPKQIMKDNALANTSLRIGQMLTIGGSGTGTASKIYRVQSGDSPFLIAKKHNMTLNRLLSLNRLSKRSKIYPGQPLKVE